MVKKSIFSGKLLTVIFALSILGLLISGCTSTPSSSDNNASDSDQVYTVNFVVQHPGADPLVTVTGEAYKRYLWDASNHRIKLNIIPGSAAVSSSADIYDAVRTGVVEMGCHSSTRTPGRFPLTDFVSLPGIINTPGATQTGKILSDLYEKYPEIQDQFEGVKVLNFHATSNAIIFSNTPIRTVDDWKGKIVRTSGEYSNLEVELFGAKTVVLAPSEYADAAVKGVFDVHGASYSSLYVFGLGDLFKYCTNFPLLHGCFYHVMNEKFYESLPADLQELFSWENSKIVSELYGWETNKEEMELKAKFEAGLAAKGLESTYNLPADEYAKWLKIVEPVEDLWLETASAKSSNAQTILDDAKALAEQYSYENYHPDMEETLANWLALPEVP